MLAAIILSALALRLINISSPILDLYPIRQEYCAMVARNFLRGGFNIFNPQVDWVGNLNPYWSAEFPIISFLAALLYKIFGIHELLGRLVAIGFSIGSIFFFYKLVRRYYADRIALFCAACFSIMPLGIYFGRVFMPEPVMLFFSIAAVYLFSVWSEDNKPEFFLFATASAALTFLAKVSSLFLCAVFLYLFYLKYNKRFIVKWQTWLFFVLAILPSFFWYERSNIAMASYIFDPINLKYLTSQYFYERMFISAAFFMFTPVGLVLFSYGLLAKGHGKRKGIFYIWLISSVGYVLLYPMLNSKHYYYQIPLLAPCAFFMGVGLDAVYQRFAKSRWLVILLLAGVLFSGLFVIRPFYRWNHSTYEAARIVNRITEKGSIIIAGRCTQEAPLYYCDRKGWVINEFGELSYIYNWEHKDKTLKDFPRLEEVELIKYLIKNGGARYYLSANLSAFNNNPKLVRFMRENFPVLYQTDKYIIFNLRQDLK